MSDKNTAFARITIRVKESELAERVCAEAYGEGAEGLEELEDEWGIRLLVYAQQEAADRLATTLALPGAEILSVEPVVPVDWSEAWKRELGPIEISPSLRVRPSFTPAPLRSGQRELLIDPGLAFGTGAHESTRLALEWVAGLAPELGSGARLLDVGTGSGVLALAALRVSSARAVALDLDPLASEAARANAAANHLADRLACFTGPLAALREAERFDFVVSNMLGSELRPIFDALAARVAVGGHLVISGLLVAERESLRARGQAAGLQQMGERRREDDSGVEWVSLCMRHSASP